jgi:flagellar biosynthesis protein FlhG
MIFDSGTGISSKVTTLNKLTDIVLIVTTPEIAAVADSYAVAKFQINTDPASRIGLVVNRVGDDREGKQTAVSLRLMIRKFLGCELPDAAVVPECRELRAIVLSRSILTPGNEDSGWTSAMGAVCRMLTDCLPENLNLWAKGHWGMSESLSLLNIGKENDDTLHTAPNIVEDSATAEHELLTSRKDSL